MKSFCKKVKVYVYCHLSAYRWHYSPSAKKNFNIDLSAMWKYSIIQRNSKQIIWKVYEREVNYRWLDDENWAKGKVFMWSDFCVVLSSFLKSITQCVHPRTHDFDEKFVNVFDYWEVKWMLFWRWGKSFSSSFFHQCNFSTLTLSCTRINWLIETSWILALSKHKSMWKVKIKSFKALMSLFVDYVVCFFGWNMCLEFLM